MRSDDGTACKAVEGAGLRRVSLKDLAPSSSASPPQRKLDTSAPATPKQNGAPFSERAVMHSV